MAKFQTTSDASTGGGFVSEEGLYHMVIVDVQEQPTNSKGYSIDNVFCKVFTSVLASSVEGQRDKAFSEIFFLPKPDAKSDFVAKKITRLLLATNLMGIDQLGEDVDVNLDDMKGAQLMLKIEKNEGGYAQISFADIYHVDDPDVKGWPKDEAALAMIDKNHRGFKSIPKQEKKEAQPALDMDDDTPF